MVQALLVSKGLRRLGNSSLQRGHSMPLQPPASMPCPWRSWKHQQKHYLISAVPQISLPGLSNTIAEHPIACYLIFPLLFGVYKAEILQQIKLSFFLESLQIPFNNRFYVCFKVPRIIYRAFFCIYLYTYFFQQRLKIGILSAQKTFALVNNLFHSDPLLAWPQTSFAGCQTKLIQPLIHQRLTAQKNPALRRGL